MSEITTTVQMDRNGRLVVPKHVRKALEVNNKAATVTVDVEVVTVEGDSDE